MSSENKIKLLEHAASIFSLLHLYRYEYRIKNLIGKGYREIGELGLAKELQTRVVDIAKKKKFIHLYLEALVDAGIIERDLGYPLKAEELFLTALEMAEKINSNNWRVEVLRNLGYLYLKLGRLDEVKSVLSKAELLKNKISNKRFLSNLLAICGNYQHHIGNIEESIKYYEEAYRLADQTRFLERKATVLADLGTIYSSTVLNDPDKGRDYLIQAKKEAQRVSYVKGYLSILCRLAQLEENTEDGMDKALDYYGKAYKLALKKGFLREQGDSLLGIGNLLWKKRDYVSAQKRFEEAKKIFVELGYLRDAAYLLEKEGDLYIKRGLSENAIAKFQEAISNLENILFIESIWLLWKKIGNAYESLGKKVESYESYSQAITSIEKMRSTLLDETRKTTFISRRLDVYQDMIFLCLSLTKTEAKNLGINALEKTYEFIESAKSRVLIDMLGNVQIRVTEIEDSRLHKRREELEDKLDILLEEVKKNPASIKYRSTYIRHRETLVEQYYKTYKEWQGIIETLRKKHPEYASLRQVDIINLKELRETILVDSKAAIIEYFIAEAKVVLLVIKSSTIYARVVEIEGAELKSHITNYLYKLTNIVAREAEEIISAAQRIKEDSKHLFELLLEPIFHLLHDISFVTLVPHDFLHNFPFHTLVNPLSGKAISSSFEICYSPSATILRYCKEKNSRSYQTYLGIGNPKTDSSDLIDLPNSEFEVKEISALFKNAYTFVGSSATKENFFTYAPKSNAIHLACHGRFDKNFPLLSCLYLSSTEFDRGYLTAAEIFNLHLQLCSIVTLSACQSGVSKIIQGDELIGLSRAFLYAGAPSMLVTLWQIDDETTQIFMETFYRCILQGDSKSLAMKTAQDHLNGINEIYAHPFFWGSFILIGDNL